MHINITMEQIQQIINDREWLDSIEISGHCIKVQFNLYDHKIFDTVEEFDDWLTEMDNV